MVLRTQKMVLRGQKLILRGQKMARWVRGVVL
jgi:hypothetical protein